jgi:dUTP pyrophosphatase
MEQVIMNTQQIIIEAIADNAVIPKYAHSADEDAGADLVATEGVTLYPGVPALISTGIKIAMPPGVQAEIRSRSGLAFKHGIRVLNSPGTIDPGYRGELKVILEWNGHMPNIFQNSYTVRAGDRIAQIVFMPYIAAEFVPGDVGSFISERGEGGGGSTGK